MEKDKFEGLRKKAEELLARTGPQQPDEKKEMAEILHELAVYQAELEMQNKELRDTQRRLQENKNDYFELYEYAPVGYMNIDQRGMVMSVNLTAVKLFNLPRNKLLGRYFSEFVDKAYHDAFFRHLEKVPNGSKTVTCELVLHKPDNTPLFARLESLYAGMTIRGERTIRTTIMDMTELNQARRQLHSLNADLEKQVAERSALADRRLEQVRQLNLDLIRAEQRERRHLAEILHDDLQQVLLGCKYQLSFLRSNKDEKQREEFINQTEETLKQAIDISRSLSHELYPPVLYHSGLAASLNWFSEQIKKMHGLTIDMCLNSQTQRFPREIEIFYYQCARELLLNIVKHSKVDTARLTLDYNGEGLSLRTADAGAGFDGQKLFCREEDCGGFGLLNMKRRIETMGGTFDVQTTKGKGCTVTLTLPCALEEVDEPDEPDTPDAPQINIAEIAAPKPAKKRKKGVIKVMLVDDHQILRRGLARLLETRKDIAVIAEAEDGKQAIENARRCKPDVILMDISLPEMDGIETTARILEENPAAHVIALTLHEDPWMVDQMLEAGACRYLTKNAPAEDLFSAIRNAAGVSETIE